MGIMVFWSYIRTIDVGQAQRIFELNPKPLGFRV